MQVGLHKNKEIDISPLKGLHCLNKLKVNNRLGTLLPSNRATMGILRSMVFAAFTIPLEMTAPSTMPPDMFTRIAST